MLAGIPPAELRRRAASLALARRAMDPDHLLHHTITREETQPRLKSRRPFASNGNDLLSTALPNETKAHWIGRTWSAEWQPSTSRLREYIVSPSKCCPGSDLPRQAWVKLNRLRTGVGRFNAEMWRWGLSKSPACHCGADQQTANHIIVHQMVFIAWLMLMQMQQLVSGFSASSQWSNYFFCFYGFTLKKQKTPRVFLRYVISKTDCLTSFSFFYEGLFVVSEYNIVDILIRLIKVSTWIVFWNHKLTLSHFIFSVSIHE